MGSLQIKVVTNAYEFAKLEQDWQTLAAQDEQAGLFNDWQWNRLWWEHYGHLGELLVLLVYDEQQLVGIGPFYRTRSPALGLGKLDTLRFIGTGGDTSPDDLNILVYAAMRQTITDFICDHLFSARLPGRLLLNDVNTESAFYKAFTVRASERDGYKVNSVVQLRRWATLPEDWSGFRKQISRNTHKQMKRRQNRLDSVGNASMQVCRTMEDVNAAFEGLINLHVARWQSKGQSGSFDSVVYQAFHRSLVQEMFEREQLWLLTLKLENQIIAVEYAFMYKQTLMFFQTGFNPEFEYLSPGHVLMTFAIQQAISTGANKIDLLKGDYEYKTSYADKEHKSANLIFYRRGLFSVLARANDLRISMRS